MQRGSESRGRESLGVSTCVCKHSMATHSKIAKFGNIQGVEAHEVLKLQLANTMQNRTEHLGKSAPPSNLVH